MTTKSVKRGNQDLNKFKNVVIIVKSDNEDGEKEKVSDWKDIDELRKSSDKKYLASLINN